MRNLCCLCKKPKVKGSGAFYKIPTDERRRNQWSEICRRQFSKDSLICEDHFVASHIIKRATICSLMPSAVPCLRLFTEKPIEISDTEASGSTSVNISIKRAKKSKLIRYIPEDPIAVDHTDTSSSSINFNNNVRHKKQSYSDHLFPEDPIAVGFTETSCSSTNFNNNMCPQEFYDITMGDPLVVPESTVRYADAETQTETTILQRQLETYKAMNENLQAEIKVLKSQLETKNKVIGFMRTIFTEGQMRKILTPVQVRWGRKDISSAIRLHASGPRAYNYMLKKGFPLPPVSTLEFWCRKVTIDEGFLSTAVGFMKHCTELTNEDKMCVLAFDELKVVETYENDSTSDSRRKPMDYAQVVVAQGLWKSWKRPVFFDFSFRMKKDVLRSIIAELNQAKFPVVAMVCDTKPNNRKLLQEMGVTKDKPWFPNPVNPQEKVFVFFDAPNLIEQIRNQFLATGLLWNSELLTSRTIADAIKHISNSSTNITFDVTDEHLSVRSVEGQELAAELFSKTTEKALRRCYAIGMNVYKAIEAADLIQLLSDWYDVLNSTRDSFTTPGKEPFGIALADQQRILAKMNEYMSSPIAPNKTTLENYQEGVIMTNTALVMLQEYIKQKFGMTYVLTNRINQHELRHLFGAIRSKGDMGERLTPNNFKPRLKKYILAQNLMHFYDAENLESESSTKTQADTKITNNHKEAEDESDVDHELIEVVHDEDEECNPDSENVEIDDTDSPNAKSTLVSSKNVSNQIVTYEIDADHVNENDVLHEIVADRDPEVLDELDTANVDDDVGTFVEDAFIYITDYTFSQ